jgi:hypothetical protein
LWLHLADPGELTPLPASDQEMRRFAEAGLFPLMAAASAAERTALAAVAGLQTFGGLFAMFLAFAYGARRGYANPRARGWSNALWASSVVGLAAANSIFPGLSVQNLDYLITSYGTQVLKAPMSPMAILIARGGAAAALAAFFLVLGHDLAYRLREALEDFGLVKREERGRRPTPRTGDAARSGQNRKPHRAEAEAKSGFGQQESPQSRSAPMSQEARARAVLGVGISASKREIERAYRIQIKRAHPDHGGSVERAAALNAARDVLLGH